MEDAFSATAEGDDRGAAEVDHRDSAPARHIDHRDRVVERVGHVHETTVGRHRDAARVRPHLDAGDDELGGNTEVIG